MFFKVYQLRSWGNPPSPEFKVITADGSGVFFVTADQQRQGNYVMINKNRQYVALVEQTVNEGAPAWKFWNGTTDLGCIDIAKRGPYTYDLNSTGLHVTTSAAQLTNGVTEFTNNDGAAVGRLFFGEAQLKKNWILEINSPEYAIPAMLMLFIITKSHRLRT
ncbi:MAG: hypothetical protein K5869_05080 [Saccharofermentans sp.]|nr:hypothetical protein [Saccharofermentans sp.]